MTYLAQISTTILNLPTIQQWPALAGIIQNITRRPHLDWELPRLAATAVGFTDNQVLVTGSAAIACMQISIILVDDMLDEDPRGLHHREGSGMVANMALALQAGAMALLSALDLPPRRKTQALSLVARMGLQTAYGQQMDVAGGEITEERYWSLIRAKSAPFYATALELGGVLAGADTETLQLFGELGTCFGEMIQIHDDMMDAFQTPANPDWLHNRLNLLLIYADKAEYVEKEQFQRLRQQIDDPDSLTVAQQILIHNGAVSFGVYHLVQRYQRAQSLLAALPRPESPAPVPADELNLAIVFERQMKPIVTLLKNNHIPVPEVIRPTHV